MSQKKVIVVGGGVAGLTAAEGLARLGARVEVVERSAFCGGHAIAFTCKAVDECVKCGACLAEDRLEKAVSHPRVRIRTGTRISGVERNSGFAIHTIRDPAFIDPDRCNGCGVCYDRCPEPGAVIRGSSSHHNPFYAISRERCRFQKDRSCTICQEACPEGAIHLKASETEETVKGDAVLLATGFKPFSPECKPYGYGVLDNVVTHLELEGLLSKGEGLKRPSDGGAVRHLAFVQCVGSRDGSLGHLWCSRVCCGAALRMAGLVRNRQPETDITVFYMDVQNFGRDFYTVYPTLGGMMRMVRAIPADLYPEEKGRVRVNYLDTDTGQPAREVFDLVVLSVGMTPHPETPEIAEWLDMPLSDTGFASATGTPGVFSAGAVTGPMGIAEAIAGAEAAAWEMGQYLELI